MALLDGQNSTSPGRRRARSVKTPPTGDAMDDKTYFRVPFEDDEVEMLLDMCEAAGRPPAAQIAAMVRDILVEDAAAHGNKPVTTPIPGNTRH